MTTRVTGPALSLTVIARAFDGFVSLGAALAVATGIPGADRSSASRSPH